MSALQRRCALMEGLICFFTSRVRVCTHHRRNPFYRETQNCIKTFLKIFLGGDGFDDSSPKNLKLDGTILPRNLLSPTSDGSALDAAKKVSALVTRTVLSASSQEGAISDRPTAARRPPRFAEALADTIVCVTLLRSSSTEPKLPRSSHAEISCPPEQL